MTSWVHPSQIETNGIENGNRLPPPPESPMPEQPKRPNISRMENLEGKCCRHSKNIDAVF